MRVRVTVVLAMAAVSCGRFGALYPSRPTPSLSPAAADPVPSRIVAHVSVTAAALKAALEDAVPGTGEGTFPLLGGERHYTWDRSPIELGFSQGRIVLCRPRVRASVAKCRSARSPSRSTCASKRSPS